MIFTSLFGLFMAIAYGVPFWAWVIGFLCFLFNPFVVPYGFFISVACNAPAWVYLVGFLCAIIDYNNIAGVSDK